jgi:pSer/pThr/pTyr-binding forkhead associated (FHA) protein
MTMICPACNHENIDGVAFCESCGHEFGSEPVIIAPKIITPVVEDPKPVSMVDNTPDNAIPENVIIPTADTAKLIAKQQNAPIAEFSIENGIALIGRFDPDTGLVDIDLEKFADGEMISRNHAEIYREQEQWQVKDLGSENGVFIKRVGQSRFGARITQPEVLNPNDEIAFARIRFLFQSP